MRAAAALALACALWAGVASAAGAQCRQALALGLDVSGSVDAREYALQLDGLAGALSDADVQRAILSRPDRPVMLAVYEWSGPQYQRLLVDWTAITGRAVLLDVAARISGTARQAAPPGTALGAAMGYGARLLARAPECERHTLDISGDGKSNTGPAPDAVRRTLDGSGLTLNALVIGADTRADPAARAVELGELAAYFRALVISGPDAFVESATGFDDYRAAMTRKLLRELETLAVSAHTPRKGAPAVHHPAPPAGTAQANTRNAKRS